MTLSRQLILLILMIFILLFAGTFWAGVENTRTFLILQLTTQTQDAADALGLSLAPHMKNRDLAAMDTMVNAVFDSGYYQSLQLQTMSGKTLIARRNTSRIEGVPSWFIDHLTLPTPQADSIITTGWKQAGRLTLQAHPGYAYKKLWDMSVAMLRWSLLAFGLSLIATLLILKAILKPLGAVERQALAIGERKFPIEKHIPRTRELKRVVLAMNSMSAKLEQFIAKLSERAEQLRKQAHDDELTGLMNRRGFEARLNSLLRDKERGGAGALAVIRIQDLAAYNRQFGHQAGSDLLISLGKLLNRLAEPVAGATTARITGTDFAVILPLFDANAATEFGTSLEAAIHELATAQQVEDIAHAGIACFGPDSSLGAILSDADVALSQAEHQGANACVTLTGDSKAMGNEAWKTVIVHVIENRRIGLLAQDILTQQRQQMYREVLIRIRDEAGEAISPALFASMAERLNLSARLDRYIIEQATEFLEQQPATSSAPEPENRHKLGIKISARSLSDADFMRWLESYLTNHAAAAGLLCFEISEYGLLQSVNAAEALIDLAHQHGGKVVMEHFGSRLSSFQTLRRLKLDYIKLDGSYTHNITGQSDNRFFLQTVIDIAHGLDMQVIAEHVETETEFRSLTSLGVNAVQGYYFGEPAPLQ